MREALSYASFAYERLAARFDLRKSVEEIRASRAACGFPAVEGTAIERIMTSILGLGRKERLYHFMRRLKTFVRRRLPI